MKNIEEFLMKELSYYIKRNISDVYSHKYTDNKINLKNKYAKCSNTY